MPWASTREAPPCSWTWGKAPPAEDMYEEEREACDHIARMLHRLDPPGFSGRHVVELGCGRGACLLYAGSLGASRITGLDVHPSSVEATQRAIHRLGLSGQALLLGENPPALPEPPWLVWSHGVVEHLDEGALAAYIRTALAIGPRWLAFSAPNPAHPVYQAFRARHLREETWAWGYEEPLTSYAPPLREAGLEIAYDGDTSRSFRSMFPYVLGAEMDAQATRIAHARGEYPGVYTLVVARVPK